MNTSPRTFACLSGAVAFVALAINSRPLDALRFRENLPLINAIAGGRNAFSRECPDNHVLTGLRIRAGVRLDGVGIRCRPIKSDGTLGTEINVGGMAGGNGGTPLSPSCSSNAVIASQAGHGDIGIYTLTLGCYEWYPASRSWGGSRKSTIGMGQVFNARDTCTSGTQPATGIRGNHGSLIDSFGLHCSTP